MVPNPKKSTSVSKLLESILNGFIEFTKMAITSLKIGHFHPDFAQLRWPFLATVGLSGGGHCGGQLAWPPRISRPANRQNGYFTCYFVVKKRKQLRGIKSIIISSQCSEMFMKPSWSTGLAHSEIIIVKVGKFGFYILT